MTPSIIGENWDAGPKKDVKFTFPKFPAKKSAAAKTIKIYPINCINTLKQKNKKKIQNFFQYNLWETKLIVFTIISNKN